jgi:hypothetical protein
MGDKHLVLRIVAILRVGNRSNRLIARTSSRDATIWILTKWLMMKLSRYGRRRDRTGACHGGAAYWLPAVSSHSDNARRDCRLRRLTPAAASRRLMEQRTNAAPATIPVDASFHAGPQGLSPDR